MGRKRRNVPAGLISVFLGLLWGQEQDRARDMWVIGDRLVTEEFVYCTVPRNQILLFLLHPPSHSRSRMRDIKQVTEV